MDLIAIHQLDYCDPNPCINGSCQPSLNSYKCICKAGYSGSHCDQGYQDMLTYCTIDLISKRYTIFFLDIYWLEMNGCLSNPCRYGQCIDNQGSYRCICNQGYTGLLCNQGIIFSPLLQLLS